MTARIGTAIAVPDKRYDMDIIYSDRELAVIRKPVGMDSEHQVPAAIMENLSGEVFPIHRLDLNVGGVMVYARTKQAAARLSRLVQEGQLVKEYRCLVHGTPPERDVLEDFLFKDSRKNKVFVVKKERKGVKKASLEYTRLTDADPALLHIRLHTGRSHQIRVQFASRGFPLVGDHKYGSRDEAKAPALFSCRISFPWKGENRVFEAFPEWGNESSH